MKNFKRIVPLCLCFITLLFNSTCVQASETQCNDDIETIIIDASDSNIIEGYTQDGIHFTATISVIANESPKTRIIHSETYSCHMSFDGHITPPKQIRVGVEKYGTTFWGTLYLYKTEFDDFLWMKSTIAWYSGTIIGQI